MPKAMKSALRLASISLVLLGAACAPGSDAQSQAQFDQLVKTSTAELQLKQQANQVWGVDKFDRWDLDQKAGTLVFSRSDGTRATCPAQIIGSFNTEKKTWLWAWDNASVEDALKADSRKVKAYGDQHKIARLTEPSWSGEEQDAWDMTAVAAHLCDAQGAYRGPSGALQIYLIFGKVTLSKSR